MSEQKKTPNFEDAVAVDWYNGIQNDLSKMSSGQLEVTKRALADFVTKKTDSSQADMEKRIAKMTTRELQDLCNQGDDEARRRNGG